VVHSAGFSKGGPVAAIVEKHEVPIGDVVQNRNADLERHRPVVPPVDQQDGRLDAGEVLCLVGESPTQKCRPRNRAKGEPMLAGGITDPEPF
jgi:hypothetical protein